MFFITLGTYLSLSAQSQQISLDEAKMAAITRVANQKQISRSTISVSDVAYYNNDNGNTLIYEIVTDKGVTVLPVAADVLSCGRFEIWRKML